MSACKNRQSVTGHFKGTVKVHGAYTVTYKTFRKILHKHLVFWSRAKSENLSSVIYIYIYIYGAWQTMLYYVICGQFFIISM